MYFSNRFKISEGKLMSQFIPRIARFLFWEDQVDSVGTLTSCFPSTWHDNDIGTESTQNALNMIWPTLVGYISLL